MNCGLFLLSHQLFNIFIIRECHRTMGQRFTQLQQKQRQRDKLTLYLFGFLLAVVSVISLSVGYLATAKPMVK
ncbi:hypothetical protein [Pragia fontium]|uniref:hypothetical protein n=1 Tax=Pragia fontium TaxID=82985 RepID=UPI00064A4D42|nr:hypothetical protein [Pragia fontium]AKJ43193.1 hypothetical protein QQ39_14895 [Pragia fontium]